MLVNSSLPELLQSKEYIKVDLKDCRLTSVDFLLKYVKMHSNVAKVDLRGNNLSDDQIEKLFDMLKANIVITQMDYTHSKKNSGIEKELEKNTLIQAIMNDQTMLDKDFK